MTTGRGVIDLLSNAESRAIRIAQWRLPDTQGRPE